MIPIIIIMMMMMMITIMVLKILSIITKPILHPVKYFKSVLIDKVLIGS